MNSEESKVRGCGYNWWWRHGGERVRRGEEEFIRKWSLYMREFFGQVAGGQ